MKSLVLKDLYNIGHNVKPMLFIMTVFAFIFIRTSGADGYIFVCAVLCSTMIVTTFSFDDLSKWTRYAMIMPISGKDLVMSKFIVLAIFCAAGSLFGMIAGFIGEAVLNGISFKLEAVGELSVLTLGAWGISVVFGSMAIPLVFRFGAERGRLLLLVSYFVPSGICFGIYKLLAALGIVLTDRSIFVLLGFSPLFALVWCFVMYKISFRIFVKTEF